MNAGSGESLNNRYSSQCVTASTLTAVFRIVTLEHAIRKIPSNIVPGRIADPVKLAKKYLYMIKNGQYVESDLFKEDGMSQKQIAAAAKNTHVKVYLHGSERFIPVEMNVTWVCKVNSQTGKVDINARPQ